MAYCGCYAPARRGTTCPHTIRRTKPAIEDSSCGSARAAGPAPPTLAEDLRDRGKIDLSEAFIDATFASAKKGALRSVEHVVAKAPRSWRFATAAVFLSPCTSPALHRMSRTSSPPLTMRGSSPTSRGA